MDQRAIIDVICKAGVENLPGEVGALLGQELSCSDLQIDIVSKEQFFSDPARPKTALTRMTVSGDRDGNCYLLTPITSAAIFAGTLIMLPEDMIEESVTAQSLDGELLDAFGEVANIIAGIFTQAFVDKYKHTLRFIKKSVEDLIPTKIDPQSDEPFPPGNYHLTKCSLSLGERDLGALEFIVPAVLFDLEEEPAGETPAEEAAQPAAPAAATQATEQPQQAEAAPTPAQEPETVEQPPPAPVNKVPFAEAKKTDRRCLYRYDQSTR